MRCQLRVVVHRHEPMRPISWFVRRQDPDELLRPRHFRVGELRHSEPAAVPFWLKQARSLRWQFSVVCSKLFDERTFSKELGSL